VILRLALRSLAVRPWRTAVLAGGFGLGIAVMVALLGVGEVIIEQAHSPALRGGGDVVVSAAFGPVENARYVLAHVLGAPTVRTRQTAASPSRRARLYLVKPGLSIAVSARGGIPSLERAVGDPEVEGVAAWTDTAADAGWSNPRQEDILRAMDRFHALPQAPRPQGSDPTGSAARASAKARGLTPPIPESDSFRSSWAEWLYFNGRTADGRLRFYLTFLAGAPAEGGPGVRPQGPISPGAAGPGGQTPRQQRPAFVRLQLERDGHSTNYSAGALVDDAELIARAPDLDIAGNRVRLEGSQYRLTLALAKEGDPRARLDGELILDAPPGRSLPPTAIHGARGWVSGYVVPVLSGTVHGSLRAGGETIDLDGATGYHDHNWGFWEGVRWQWGQVAHGDLSIVFGRVFPPASVADPQRTPGVLAVLGPNGPLGFATDVSIEETPAPHSVTIRARGQRLDITLALDVEETVGTRMGLTRMANGQTMTFLQMGGTYRVTGTMADRPVNFTARGSAETFRSQ
jgi:hypothetical protein